MAIFQEHTHNLLKLNRTIKINLAVYLQKIMNWYLSWKKLPLMFWLKKNFLCFKYVCICFSTCITYVLKWWELTFYLLCRSYCVNMQTNVFWIVCAVSFLLDPAYKYANYIPSYTCLIWVCKMRTLFYTLNKEGKGLKKIVLKYVQQKIYLFFLSHWACGILVPRPGMELTSCVVEARSLKHPTTRKIKNLPF